MMKTPKTRLTTIRTTGADTFMFKPNRLEQQRDYGYVYYIYLTELRRLVRSVDRAIEIGLLGQEGEVDVGVVNVRWGRISRALPQWVRLRRSKGKYYVSVGCQEFNRANYLKARNYLADMASKTRRNRVSVRSGERLGRGKAVAARKATKG